MKLGRLDYCLSIKDIKKSFDFYSKLDFQIVEGKVEENWVVVEHGNLRLGLYQDERTGSTLNFRGANMLKVAELIKELGISPVRSKYYDDGTGSITIKDPDGYVLFFDTHETELHLGENLEIDLSNIYHAKPNLLLGRTDLCLDVSNIETSLKFYKNLGLEEKGGNIEEQWVILTQSNLRLALFEANKPSTTINFRGGNVRNIFASLESKGIKFEKLPEDEEDGSVGATLRDPDDNLIYFNTSPEEVIMYK